MQSAPTIALWLLLFYCYFFRSLRFLLRGNQIEISEQCDYEMPTLLWLLNTTLMVSVNYLRIKMRKEKNNNERKIL